MKHRHAKMQEAESQRSLLSKIYRVLLKLLRQILVSLLTLKYQQKLKLHRVTIRILLLEKRLMLRMLKEQSHH